MDRCSSPADRQQAAPEHLLLDVRTAARVLSVSTRTAARLISTGKLKGVRIGRRLLVEAASVRALVAQGGTR